MEVYSCNELIINTHVISKYIDFENVIQGDGGIMIPYSNKTFLCLIRSLIDDAAAKQSVWKEPDYENSKCYFYITEDQINLLVEAVPKRYSASEKQIMLQNADQTIRDDGYSDYYEMLDMLCCIDEILSTSEPIGEMCLYEVKMSELEIEKISSILNKIK